MDEKRKKLIVRLVILGIIGELAAAALVLYLMSPGGKGVLEWVKNTPEPVLKWFGIGFAILLIIAFILGVRQAGVTPPEFAKVASELGISITRNPGPEGTSGRFGLFGYGQFFEGNYRGSILSYSVITDEDGRKWGTRLALRHLRPLSLGLLCKYRASPLTTPGRLADEYKDIFAGELEIGEEGLKVWAVEVEKAGLLFADPEVKKALRAFRDELGNIEAGDSGIYGRCGFVMNDKTIAVFLPDPSFLKKRLVETMYDLSNSIVNTGMIPAVPVVRVADRIYRAVVVCLSAATILFAVLQLREWVAEFFGF